MSVAVFNDINAYYDSVRNELAKSANGLVEAMSPANVDFTLYGKPTFSSKTMTLGGKKFQVHIHTIPAVTEAMSKHTGKSVKAVVQIWNGSRSALFCQTDEHLDDARKDYTGGYAIPEDKIVEQSIAAIRLNTGAPILHHIAMFCAYEHKSVKGELIHRVWD